MAHKPNVDRRDWAGTALVIGTALLGGGVVYAILYAASVYFWR
jgi:hypothetical protein